MNQAPPGFAAVPPPPPPPHGHPGGHPHHHPGHHPGHPLHLPPPIPPIPQNGYINGNGSIEATNGGDGNGVTNGGSGSNGPSVSGTPVIGGARTTIPVTAPSATGAPHSSTSTTPSPSEFDLSSYVYNAGFIHAAWADTFLNISPHPPLRLHALFASRSPLLYNILANYAAGGPPYHVTLANDDKYLTSSALSLAVATLYGHPLDIQSCDLELAKGLLSAGNLLALDDVSSAGYQALINLLNLDTVQEILDFALSYPKPEEGSITSGTSSSRASPDVQSQQNQSSSPNPNSSSSNITASTSSTTPAYEDLQITYPGPYPRFTNNLLSIIVDFILVNFKDTKQHPKLRSILLTLPFHIYKYIIESDKLAVKSHMERHSFAREMTNLREQHRRKNNSSRPVIYEENVVLAFGGGKGGVEVIRKPIGKKKTLWKASQ